MACLEEEKEGSGAATAEQTEEPLSSGCAHSLSDAAVERTQEQQSSRGRFRRTAQLVCKFIKRIRQEETITRGAAYRPYSPIFQSKTSAALLYMLVEEDCYHPKQVPAMVRYIHQWLLANDSAEHRLDKTLLNLTEALTNDAVMTLLRVAPSCDRAAMAMWKTIMGSSRTAKPVQLTLLDVLGNWPVCSTCTSDGDKTGVFALACSSALWICQERWIPSGRDARKNTALPPAPTGAPS
ncbi:uncharacterized protein LOC135278302 [Passer domesticus]|uniref:uncharacterized protein LOC135278302 n=1 Tax=Passer domesticus TaxID=48849 RepID=UPI0030FE0B1F